MHSNFNFSFFFKIHTYKTHRNWKVQAKTNKAVYLCDKIRKYDIVCFKLMCKRCTLFHIKISGVREQEHAILIFFTIVHSVEYRCTVEFCLCVLNNNNADRKYWLLCIFNLIFYVLFYFKSKGICNEFDNFVIWWPNIINNFFLSNFRLNKK